jgi:hypothetical protein
VEPSDDAHAEVEHGQVGVLSFFPAHQQAAESMQEGVGALHHPPPRLLASALFRRARMWPSRAHVPCEAVGIGPPAHLLVVIAGVQAQVLASAPGGPGAPDWHRVKGLLQQLVVVRVGASDHEAEGDTSPVG